MKPLLPLTLAALLAASAPTAAFAQAPSAPAAGEVLPVEIGRAAGKGGGDGSMNYQVFATAPLNAAEKGQRLQFITRETGGGRASTAYTIVNTGKSKSLSQLADTLGVAMRKFSAGGAAPGQEFGKVGDLRYGGELRLVAVDANSLRFEYNPPTARPVTFTRADAAAFAGILGK